MEQPTIAPSNVHFSLERHLLVDGFPFVLDMERSRGPYLYDAVSGRKFVDFFTFFASNPLGMNHPKMLSDDAFLARLKSAALNKVSNADIYTTLMARFVDTFSRVGIPDALPRAFFVSGGALAVENALKAAFDWKVRKNFQKGHQREVGSQVMHLKQAFHGRSGYTLSLTNTEPRKIDYFPKFDWPRILNPKANVALTPDNLPDIEASERASLEQAKRYFQERKDDIACVIVEPIQGEGGDNHFRAEFLIALRDLAHDNDALFVFDEVQTGVGLTGTFWAYEQLGVTPDILAFGKKAQICGILAGGRIEEIEENVFEVPSRINSTWGGNLVDMVRFDRILEIIEEDALVENAARVGRYLLDQLKALASKYERVENPRGRGLMCAFDLPDAATRNAIRDACFEKGLIILPCGEKSLRFRPALTATNAVIDEGIEIVRGVMDSLDQ